MNTHLAINVRAVTYGLRLTLGLVLLVMLNGYGSSVKVVADHDPATDFSAYRTYKWMPEPETDQMQRGLIWRDIKQAIDNRRFSAVFDDTLFDRRLTDIFCTFTIPDPVSVMKEESASKP
ncbi:MAG: hypothetical protein O6948_06905 [Deltaproteobacteria bacterium]|nr:hypothetical protein [Deltaproteobacteria bacterium]